MQCVLGLSALHWAVARGHDASVQVLLEFDAYPALKSWTITAELGMVLESGSTPLHAAARTGNVGMASLLLRHHSQKRGGLREVMDIRRIADSDGHTPYDVALAAKSRNTSPVLLHMLNPATDLLRVFTVQELAVPVSGVVRLTILSAAALQSKLLSDLDTIAPQTSSSASHTCTEACPSAWIKHAATSVMDSPAISRWLFGRRRSLTTGGSVAHKDCTTSLVSPHQHPSSPAACCSAAPCPSSHQHPPAGGEQWEEEGDAECCMVCMAARLDVRIAPCGHQLCSGCARQLCARMLDKPQTCPFCRGPITGFSS